jgi:outer membrane protein assembly factor BamB
MVFFSTRDFTAWAVTPDGELSWVHSYPKEEGLYSSPVLDGLGRVYFGTRCSSVTALTTDTGTPDFSYDAPAGFYVSEPAIGLSGTLFYSLEPSNWLNWGRLLLEYNPQFAPVVGTDGTLYIPFGYGLRAFEPTDGSMQWEYRGADHLTGLSPAIGSDGAIYLGGEGALIAIAADGTLRWRFERSGTAFLSPAIGSDGTIYVGTRAALYWSPESVFAVGADGTLRWAHPGRNCLSSPVIDDRNRIYVTMDDGILLALNSAGEEEWMFEQQDDEWTTGTPALGSDGTLYLGTRRGRLVAIRTGSGGLSPTAPWPRFRGGNSNRGRPGG